MQTRVSHRIGAGDHAPPGMPVVATGAGSAEAAAWQLRHGAIQLLCVPPSEPLPARVIIHTLDSVSRRSTLAVAASLLRHVPAEAVYLGIHPIVSLEKERAAGMRDLLDARSVALAEHGLDMRTELRAGDVATELHKELLQHPPSMLVLGTSNPEALRWDWLGTLLEGDTRCAVLIVNASRADVSAAEAA